jgi:urate oxidase
MGYIEDEYTNLKPVGAGGASPDRIMCTDLTTRWTYTPGQAPEGKFVETNEKIFKIMMDTFAGNPETGIFSKSIQETAYK